MADLRKLEEVEYVGWCCTYLPLELIEAFGLVPYRLLPEEESPEGASLLDPNLCPYVRSLVGYIERRRDLKGIVLLNSCDGMRRLFDLISLFLRVPCFLLDVPRGQGPAEIIYFRECLEQLVLWLEGISGRRLEEEALLTAIAEANETRALLKVHMETGARPSFIFRLMRDSFAMGREAFNERLRRLPFEERREKGKISILLTGSLLEKGCLVELIEDLGVHVEALDLCTGPRFAERVEVGDDPLLSLSRAYLTKPACARMVCDLRESYLERSVASVQGVIYYAPKFCDPYLYSLLSLRRLCKKEGVPLLVLEGDYSGRLTGGMRTRVEAFVERWI